MPVKLIVFDFCSGGGGGICGGGGGGICGAFDLAVTVDCSDMAGVLVFDCGSGGGGAKAAVGRTCVVFTLILDAGCTGL